MWEPLRQWFLDPSSQRLLLGVGLSLAAGLFLGSRRRRSRKDSSRSETAGMDEAYVEGVHHILAGDYGRAIEAFTESVKTNSDNVNAYVTLAHLYSSKGEVERAIRIRENLILRPNIDKGLGLKVLFDLGLDYTVAGYPDKALKAFLKVSQGEPSNAKVLEKMERVFEETKDWEGAYQTRQKIARLIKGIHYPILAHHLVEMGKSYLQNGEQDKAKSFFNRALSTHRECMDAYLQLGDLYFTDGEYKKALLSWKKAVEAAPDLGFLVYDRLQGVYSSLKDLKPVGEFLEECLKLGPNPFVYLALAHYHQNEVDIEGALRHLDDALQLDPCFWDARRLKGEILVSEGKDKQALIEYKDLLTHLIVPYAVFRCSHCGLEPEEHQWQCARCKRWDTISEVRSAHKKTDRILHDNGDSPQPAEKAEEA